MYVKIERMINWTLSRALDHLDYGRKHTISTLGRMAVYIAKGWLYCNQRGSYNMAVTKGITN